MPKSRNFVCHITVTAMGAGVSGVALVLTSGGGDHSLVIVSFCGNDGLGRQHLVANRANHTVYHTLCGASGISARSGFFGMPKGRNFVCHITVTAMGAGVCGVALVLTSRRCNRGFVIVVICGNLGLARCSGCVGSDVSKRHAATCEQQRQTEQNQKSNSFHVSDSKFYFL